MLNNSNNLVVLALLNAMGVYQSKEEVLSAKDNIELLRVLGTIDEEAIEFCKRMIDIFQLAKAFIIDVALTDNGCKIVECGCINCAGFYNADIQKLLIALEQTEW